MLRPPSIPVESPALSFAPKPKPFNQPKHDGLAALDRSAFRTSLKEAQTTPRSQPSVDAVREPASAKEAPRAKTTEPAAATNARDAGNADDRSTGADSVTTPAASSPTAKQDDPSREATTDAPVAATDAPVPTDAATSAADPSAEETGTLRAASSAIAAGAPTGAVDAPINTATGNQPVTGAPAASLEAAGSPIGAGANAAVSATSLNEAAISPVDREQPTEPVVIRQDSARAATRATTPLPTPASAADATTSAASAPTVAPTTHADVRPAINPASNPVNTAPVDAASSAVSATAPTGSAAEQQAHTGDEQSRGEGRSQDGRSSNLPSFGAARGEGDAPAIARAESIDQAVKLSQATGRMPTAMIEGLPGSAAPNSPSAVGARDAVTAQFVPMNAAADETSPFASRVVRGLHTMLNHRGGSMTMRLDPPELGALKVQMTLRDGAVTAMFTAATAKAHSLLREHMGTLRASLESQGLTVERLSVQSMTTTTSGQNASDANTRQDQSGAQSDRQQADAGHGQSRGHREHEARGDGTRARQHAGQSFEQSFEEQLAG